MSYSLNSLKGVIWGIIWGTTRGVIKGDTRSLDYSSCVFFQDFTWEEFGELPLVAFVGFSAYGLESRLEAAFFGRRMIFISLTDCCSRECRGRVEGLMQGSLLLQGSLCLQ